jgi:SAM-dependent methyltransferase
VHAVTLPAEYFDSLYAAEADPWAFASSDYEREKYAATLAALPRPRYDRALEIGCSIGVLTRMLAGRCDAVVALDVAETALAAARDRCADLPGVAFHRMAIPGDWPAGQFDLILLSEVVYYLDEADVARLVTRLREALAPEGDVMLVHWTGETDYPLTGDAAATLVIEGAAGFLAVTRQEKAERYRLDLLRRVAAG